MRSEDWLVCSFGTARLVARCHYSFSIFPLSSNVARGLQNSYTRQFAHLLDCSCLCSPTHFITHPHARSREVKIGSLPKTCHFSIFPLSSNGARAPICLTVLVFAPQPHLITPAHARSRSQNRITTKDMRPPKIPFLSSSSS